MTDDILNPDERDVPLEPRLQDAARAYNPPPATPREAMWAKIAEARAAARTSEGAPAVAPVAPETRVIPIDAARARRRPTRTWAILAGTLAAGIALGVFGRDLWHTRETQPSVVAHADSPAVKSPSDTGAQHVAAQEAAPGGLLGNGASTPPKGGGLTGPLSGRLSSLAATCAGP